jgi:hypothetical protein
MMRDASSCVLEMSLSGGSVRRVRRGETCDGG